jgi:hypothetical protein
MRKIFVAMALATPMGMAANGVADTTVVYNGKQIVINDDQQETRISVYTQDSTQLVKTSETKFVNKQEIERIYINSPFFPIITDRFYSSMYPTVWWGASLLSSQIGSIDANSSREGLHARGGFELGCTIAEGIHPINKRGNLIFSGAVQVVYSKNYFQNSALLCNNGKDIAFEDRTHAPASSNYMSYASMRLPFMLGFAPFIDFPEDMLGTQLGIGLVPLYRFKSASYRFEPEAFGDVIERNLNIYHWGLNVDVNIVLGPLKLSAAIGVLPVFKTSEGKKAYSSSINFGLNIGELFGKRSQNGSF